MAVEPAGKSLSQQTVSGLSWQMLSSVVKFISRFGIGIVLARLLPPEDFGIVGLAYIATGFASTLADLGLGPALIQRKEISERHVRVSQTISLAMAGVMAVVLYANAGPISDFFNDARVEPVLQVLAFTFLFSGFSITAGALLVRRLAFNVTVKIELLASIVGYGGVAVGLAVAGYGYWSLVWGTIAQTVLSATLTYLAERHSLRPLIARAELRDLFAFSTGMSLSSTVNYFARQGDYFVVGRMMSATSLGLYSRAFTLMEMPHSFLGSALSRVLFPAAARVQDDPERFRRAFLTSFSLSVAISLPITLAVAILAPEIILVLYGEKWAAAIPLLQILALFGMFRMSFNTAGAFVRARGQAFRILIAQTLYGLLVVGGSWWGAAVGGLEGVAWAVGGALFGCWLLIVGLARSAVELSLLEFVKAFFSACMPGFVTGTALLGSVVFLRTLSAPAIVVLLVGGAGAIVISGFVILRQTHSFGHPAILAYLAKANSIINTAMCYITRAWRNVAQ